MSRKKKTATTAAATALAIAAVTGTLYPAANQLFPQLPDIPGYAVDTQNNPPNQDTTPEAETNTEAPTNTTKEPEPAVEYQTTSIDPHTGRTVYNLGEDQLSLFYNEETGKFHQYAPLPAKTFTKAESQCDLTTPNNELNLTGQPTQWAIPALGPAAATGYTQTNFQLPATKDHLGRYGTWKSDTAHLQSPTGAGIYAGHVNNPDGSKSAWGYLHNVQPCMSKYITDENGVQREYKAVEVRLMTNPTELEIPDTEYWSLEGPNRIYDITCAGAYGIGDDGQAQFGGSLLAGFPYRVIVVWEPVTSV